MLYSYKLAGEVREHLRRGKQGAEPPAKTLLRLIGSLDQFLGEGREILCRPDSSSVTVLYRDVVLRCEDLMEYGDLMAQIGERWEIVACGNTPDMETGELRFSYEDGARVMRKYCISGEDFQQMSSLGLRIGLPDKKYAEFAAGLLKRFSPEQVCCAADRVWEPLLREQEIPFYADGTLFCYLVFAPDVRPEEYLHQLTLRQKEKLWNSFLEDYIQTREFEWLYDSLAERRCQRLLEWELALQTCLEELNFEVKNTAEGFQVTDGSGNVRTFDFERGGAAERAFLKILFPLRLRSR